MRKSQDKKYEKTRGKVQSVGDIAEAVKQNLLGRSDYVCTCERFSVLGDPNN